MHKILFLFVIAIVLGSGTNSKDCDLFRRGIFKMNIEMGGNIEKFRIERDDSFQVEINTKRDEKTVFRIEWKGPCKYTLKYVSGATQIKDPDMLKRLVVTTKILETGENYCVFSSKSNLFSYEIKDTLWKVE